MKVDVYTQEGKKLKTKVELNDEIFGVQPNEDLVAQYVRVYRPTSVRERSRPKPAERFAAAVASPGGKKEPAELATAQSVRRFGSVEALPTVRNLKIGR